jgi:hypothetical protein
MSEEMIAKCGLVCTECDAYIATKNQDVEALKAMAAKASEEFGLEMTWEESQCTGCLSDGQKIGYCATCGVRKCAMERGVVNCAYCDDYGCETITAFLEHAPTARAKFEEIRATLQ